MSLGLQRFIAVRALLTVPVLLLVTITSFFLLFVLPGDPVIALLGDQSLDPQTVARFRKELGLDEPLPVQYAKWLGNVVQGDWGRSIRTNQPVLEAIRERVPVTLELAVVSWLVAVVVAFPAGIIAATRRNSKLDVIATVLTMAGVALPSFWLGIMFILFFAVRLGWLPPSGHVPLTEDPAGWFQHMILPSLTLGLGLAATVMRQVRSSMLEVLAQDFVTTARAKGLRERTVIRVHALKNAFLPVVTVMGLQVSRLLGGSVIIEEVFALPGLGRLGLSAIFTRDFAVVQGTILFVALIVVAVNLLTDLTYGLLDPRIRYR